MINRCMIALVAMVLLFGAQVQASESWGTDYDAALAKSKKSGKPILVDFTGSDWCVWCIRLHDEVFAHKEFKEWAAKNVELLMLDFPQEKPLPKAEAERNNALAQKYNVRGFPTILLIDAEGKVLGRTQYQPGGTKVYLPHLDSLLKAAKKE